MPSKKDIQIITHLRQNARMPLTVMSKKTRIPVSTIFDRLKDNEKGLITRHTCLLDFEKLGYGVKANIAFKVDREDKDSLKEFLVKNHLINSVYKINNGFDFMIEAVFRQIKDMDDFMENIDSKFRIQDKKSFFIIEELKKEEFMSDPILTQEVLQNE